MYNNKILKCVLGHKTEISVQKTFFSIQKIFFLTKFLLRKIKFNKILFLKIFSYFCENFKRKLYGKEKT